MKSDQLAALAIALTVTALTGWELYQYATSPVAAEFMNSSAEWCRSRGGELVISHVIGETGGLHCRLPNGSLVEMDQVIELQP